MLKWLWKFVKYQLNFANFHSCHEKWIKFGQTLSTTKTKVHSIQWCFSRSKTFGFNEILSRFILFMTKIFCFTWISQLPILQPSLMSVGKARSLPFSGAPERCFTRVGYSLTRKIRLGWKILKVNTKIRKLRIKKFYNSAKWYKTFYVIY